jgi:hypothetical protein
LVVVAIVLAVSVVAGLRLWRAATPPGGFRHVRSDGFLGFVTHLIGDNRDGERISEGEWWLEGRSIERNHEAQDGSRWYQWSYTVTTLVCVVGLVWGGVSHWNLPLYAAVPFVIATVTLWALLLVPRGKRFRQRRRA